MNFMLQVVPLNIIYPEALPKGEIPQVAHSDVESDDDHLITRKRKSSSLGGVDDAEGEVFSVPPIKKRKLMVNLESFARDSRFPIEEVIQIEHNASVQKENVECRSSKLAQKYSSTEGGIDE